MAFFQRYTKMEHTDSIASDSTGNLKWTDRYSYILSQFNWVKTEHDTIYMYTSDWFCSDGDPAELFIEKDGNGFELSCFSGIAGPESKIVIDNLDFGTLWYKAYRENNISRFSYEEQCILIAHYLCSLFCVMKKNI